MLIQIDSKIFDDINFPHIPTSASIRVLEVNVLCSNSLVR
jgi:hypothetical protein